MAMEKVYAVRDTHTRPITALGYFPARREILVGCEGMLLVPCEIPVTSQCYHWVSTIFTDLHDLSPLAKTFNIDLPIPCHPVPQYSVIM